MSNSERKLNRHRVVVKRRCMNGQLLLMLLGRQLGKVLGVSSGQKKEDRDT